MSDFLYQSLMNQGEVATRSQRSGDTSAPSYQSLMNQGEVATPTRGSTETTTTEYQSLMNQGEVATFYNSFIQGRDKVSIPYESGRSGHRRHIWKRQK